MNLRRSLPRPLRPLCAAAAMLLLADPATAQTSLPLELDSLRPPPSPAFVLLGISPSAVERPSTPRAVSASFLAAAAQSGGLPENYAVEAAPYWLVSHPTLTLDDYEKGSITQNVIRSLAFSFATAAREAGEDGEALPGRRLGLGFRMQPFKGERSDSVRILLDELRELHAKCLNVEDTETCVDTLMSGEGIRNVALRTQKALRDRYGFTMEVAAGVVGDFPNDEFDAGRLQRLGVWVTPSYRAQHSPLQVMAVGRILRDGGDVDETAWDLGGRLYWQWEQLAVSAELVERWSGGENTERLAGILEFQLTEDLYATYTFGRDFAPPDSDENRLLSILGVNIGIGKEPTLSTPVPPPAPPPAP
jgi:hypothetical protein